MALVALVLNAFIELGHELFLMVTFQILVALGNEKENEWLDKLLWT